MRIKIKLFFHFVFFSVSCFSNNKVYDCFLFFNEIDVLKIRLNELNDLVDYFVIVESKTTFSGNEKPSYYLENKNQFSDFHKKIIHVLIDGENTLDFWFNEKFQRNQILKGIESADEEDIVICTDVDEIPRKSTLLRILRNNRSFCDKIYRFSLDWSVFKINNVLDVKWVVPCLTTVKNIREITPQGFRENKFDKYQFIDINNGGWHLSWLGDADECLYKLKSFSHAKDSFVKSNEEMKSILRGALDLKFAGVQYNNYIKLIDYTFPEYVKKNLDLLRKKNMIVD